MTVGIEKRSFESWVYRRQINLVEWLKNREIVSLSQLHEWCDENGLKTPTSPDISALFIKTVLPQKDEEPKPDEPAKKKKQRTKKSSSKDAAWHTPAADRPRRGKKRTKQ